MKISHIATFLAVFLLTMGAAFAADDLGIGAADDAAVAGFFAILATFFIIFIVIFIVFYVFMSLALMTIARKTNTPNGWLAWIPFANLYLMTQIAKKNWALIFIPIASFLLSWIPIIGFLLMLAAVIWTVWMWMGIAEARGKPGWWGILIIVPIANLVIIAMLAWKD